MRQTQLENLRSDSKRLLPSIEQLELQMQALDDKSNSDKELRHIVRLLYVGLLVEQIGLFYSLNEQTFATSYSTTRTYYKSQLKKTPNIAWRVFVENFLDKRNAAYDTLAKCFLARKAIPAYILKHTVSEFADCFNPKSSKIIQ